MACGVDEAGRGPVIGPMVVAGVCADRRDLISIGVKDSKKLSPKKREFLAEEIKKTATKIVVRIVEPEEIDRLRETITINEIEVKIFSEVILKLNGNIIYVDAADVNADRFAKEICRNLPEFFRPRIISEHKADAKYPEVSAASIIAKVERDKIIKEISKEIGDFGSGYPADPRTYKFIKEYYNKHRKLPPHTRKSWKSAKKIMKEYEQKKLAYFEEKSN